MQFSAKMQKHVESLNFNGKNARSKLESIAQNKAQQLKKGPKSMPSVIKNEGACRTLLF